MATVVNIALIVMMIAAVVFAGILIILGRRARRGVHDGREHGADSTVRSKGSPDDRAEGRPDTGDGEI